MMGGQVNTDHLKLLTCVLSTYPLALLFNVLPNPLMKHLLSIFYTCFVLIIVLSSWLGFLHLTLTSLFTYFFMKYYHGKNGPWINFFIIMVSMSICHLDRQFKGVKGDTTLDYSGALMVAIMKLSSYGFNIQDGREKNKSLIHPFHLRMQINTYPSLVSFFGWIFFFGGVLAGPTCDYMDYIRLITLPLIETSPKTLTEKQRQIKLSCWNPVKIVLLKVSIMIMGLIFIHPTFNFPAILSDQYNNYPFYKRFLFLQLTATLTRFRFYTVWLLTEGACMVTGLGFNGFDKEDQPKWDRVVVANVNVEWAPNFKILIERWNSAANRWLKHYVFMRLAPLPSSSSGSKAKIGFKPVIVTYLISSLWHGFLPGYFLFFATSALLQYVGNLMRKILRPLTMTPDMKQGLPFWKTAYDVICIILTVSCINSCSSSFMLLTWEATVIAFKSVYCYHLLVALVGMIIWHTMRPTLMSIQKRRVAKFNSKQQGSLKGEDVNDNKVKGLAVSQKMEIQNDFKTE
ncbi:unnamed protein product [Cunninghamella echinulata]